MKMVNSSLKFNASFGNEVLVKLVKSAGAGDHCIQRNGNQFEVPAEKKVEFDKIVSSVSNEFNIRFKK